MQQVMYTDITLNLESDDDPIITSIGTTGDVTSQVEDGSFEITASINSASSSDVTIPMSFQGDAILVRIIRLVLTLREGKLKF